MKYLIYTTSKAFLVELGKTENVRSSSFSISVQGNVPYKL